VLVQPGLHAHGMEPVFTRQLCNFFSDVDLVHTYTTFCATLCTEHLFRDLWLGKSIDGVLGRWAGCVAAGGLLHELRDDAVEGFLRVHKVAVLATTHGSEEAHEGIHGHLVEGVRMAGALAFTTGTGSLAKGGK
jgi:hypothetical protein